MEDTTAEPENFVQDCCMCMDARNPYSNLGGVSFNKGILVPIRPPTIKLSGDLDPLWVFCVYYGAKFLELAN